MSANDSFRQKMFREAAKKDAPLKGAPIQGAVDFIISTEVLASIDILQHKKATAQEMLTPIDMPFHRCFFCGDGAPLQKIIDGKDWTAVHSVFVQERGPADYGFLADVSYSLDNGKSRAAGCILATRELYEKDNPRDKEGYELYWLLLKIICEQINANKMAEIEPRKLRQKCWHKGQRQIYKPSSTIYISGKKSKPARSPSVPGYKFKRWIEAWRVRGHWRKYEGGIGKDRNGQRCVDGYTWVSAHEKGEGIINEKKYKVI